MAADRTLGAHERLSITPDDEREVQAAIRWRDLLAACVFAQSLRIVRALLFWSVAEPRYDEVAKVVCNDWEQHQECESEKEDQPFVPRRCG